MLDRAAFARRDAAERARLAALAPTLSRDAKRAEIQRLVRSLADPLAPPVIRYRLSNSDRLAVLLLCCVPASALLLFTRILPCP